MDFTTLSRMQFGVTIGFHYLFALSTLGLTVYILLFESLYLIKAEIEYRRISDFLIRLLAVIFVFGVATGFMMPFAFGGNWSRFSNFAGSVFGIQLVFESITSFALEAIALGILIFGRDQVSKKIFWLSALLVFVGSHLSAFWIVSANSWMQTPAGYAIVDGRVVLTGFWEAILNATTVIRFLHVVVATWIAGTFLAAGISAYHLLKHSHEKLFRRLLRISIVPMLILTLFQAFSGHLHLLKLIKHYPEKDAAYEGIFHTVKGAPLYALGIPDAANETIHFAFGLPYMLSFLESGSFTSEVKGLDEFPRELWPPVNVIFTTFHLMVMFGVAMIIIGAVGNYLKIKKKLFTQRWYFLILLYAIPLPYLANELGWIGTEMGRQPWVIYNLLRTENASTICLPASQVAISLSFIAVFYLILSVIFLKKFIGVIKTGPAGADVEV